jgi:prolipoprotein diacylglyceryl transferase
MLIRWTFDPVLVQLGPLAIRWYGVFFVGAFLIGQAILARIFKAQGIPAENAERLLLYALFGAVVGARLVHCLAYEPAFYLQHPVEILKIWEGGLASHGGVLGLLAGLIIGTRRTRPPLSILRLADCVAIPAAIGAALIRVANFLNSEIVGVPTNGHWGVVFTSVDSIPRHPVQLYEAVSYSIVAAFLVFLHRRQGLDRRGLLTGWLLFLVFLARIVLEFFKAPQASYDAGLFFSVGQLLSIPFALGGLVLLLRSLRR